MGNSWIGAGSWRENITVYDALYVALAELAGAVLLTADARLATAPGPRCEFEVIS
jgi:predicted nucleic acid-binding protein